MKEQLFSFPYIEEKPQIMLSFIEVNQTEALLVEIHSLDPKHKKLEDRFIQEIIELLRETVCTRVEMIKKKSGQQKNIKESSGILTGTSVRVGYAFKNKPGHQTCLCSSNVVQYGAYPTEEDMSYLKVVQEKVLVYVQLLAEGSPKGMSQLLRRLSDVKQSTGPGVSISSYFQKTSSSQRSQAQGTSAREVTKKHKTSKREVTKERNTKVLENMTEQKSCVKEELNVHVHKTSSAEEQSAQSCSLEKDFTDMITDSNDSEPMKMQDAPPSEGKRHKLKGILERGHFPGRKKKLRKTATTTLVDHQSHDSMIAGSYEPLDSDIVAQVGKGQTHKDENSITKSESSTVIVNSDINESHSFTVSRVDIDLHTTANSLNVMDIPGSDVELSQTNLNKDNEPIDIGDSSDDRNYVSSELEIITRVRSVNSSSSSLSDSSDSGVLPSASFCAVRNDKRLSHKFSADTLNNILKAVENRELKDIPEHGSPVFKGKAGNSQILTDIGEDSSEFPGSDDTNNNKEDAQENKAASRFRSLNRFRLKRKLPKFCEDSFPEKKRQNVSGKGEGSDTFANINNLKRKSKKMQLSKDFFSSDSDTSTAKQSKLSFFTKNKSNNPVKGIDERVSEKTEQELPDLDIDLIKEVPDTEEPINELDMELLREIHSLRDVDTLNEEHIRFLIRHYRTYLRHIFEGKLQCTRHEAYKKGGSARRNLNYASRLGPYSDEQIDVVMECLMSIFCKKHHKYLDYIMKVLLPEMLIKIHMEVHRTTQAESDRLLAPKTPEIVSP